MKLVARICINFPKHKTTHQRKQTTVEWKWHGYYHIGTLSPLHCTVILDDLDMFQYLLSLMPDMTKDDIRKVVIMSLYAYCQCDKILRYLRDELDIYLYIPPPPSDFKILKYST